MDFTIAVPSFSRPSAVVTMLRELERNPLPEFAQLIVANNGSERGSYDEVSKTAKRLAQVTYLEFQENLGFGHNLLRLLEQCSSDYVITLSDEDFIDVSQLFILRDFCIARDPSLVVLGKLTASKTRYKKLSATDIRGHTNYISGLVMKMDITKAWIPKIKVLADKEDFAYLYPQVLLGALLFAKGKAVSLQRPHIQNRHHLASSVTTRDGGTYWFPTERAFQFKSLMSCLSELENHLDPQENRKIRKFAQANERNFFGSILDAVTSISPSLSIVLIRSSFKTIMLFYIRRSSIWQIVIFVKQWIQRAREDSNL